MDRAPLRETLRWFRGNKQMTRTARIQVGGRLRPEDAAMAAQITARMQRMQQAHAAWVEKRLAGLQGYLGDITSEAVEEACYGGFQVLLRRQVRFGRKTNPASLGRLQAASFQEKMITGFVWDFFRSLKIAARLRIAPETAVKIARRSYIHPPDIGLHLQQAYPQFGPWIVIRAVANYDDPEGFLRQIEAQRIALKQAFPAFEEWVIHRAAVYHKDPHGYLRWVEATVKSLHAQPEFKGFQPVAIREAVVCHRRPEAYLKRIKEKALRLQDRFPDFDPEFILMVSLRHKKPVPYLGL